MPEKTACFSRSYAGNLPSSFSTLRSSSLVFSTSPPVSVSGTVYVEAISRKPQTARANPVRPHNPQASSHLHWPRTINLVPIDYGFRPRLRGPANPARINLAQEPLDFRRQRFSRCLSLLMSAFALPIPPQPLARLLRRPTERSATAFRRQRSEVRDQNCFDAGR